MSFHSDYEALRKKRLMEEAEVRGAEIAKKLEANQPIVDEDIAPVVTTTTKNEDNERKWFEKGAFEDGYQFGDVLKTIGASFDDLQTNVGAGIIGMGEKVVDAGAYIVGGVGSLLGADDFSNKTKDFIAKDLYDEKKIADAILHPTTIITEAILGKEVRDIENDSIFGDKTDSLAQSAGQLLGTVGLQAVGVPWFLTTGVTSFGGEVEEAFNEGATYGQAGGSALISAGAEILTEKLSGGIKFGGKTLDDVLLKPLTQKISSKTVRTLTNLGLDALGEGTEEVISSVFSNLGSSLYKEESIEELLTSEEAMDEYLESFIGGSVLGGGMGGINAGRSLKTGRDYKTGLTENEQKVVDAEFKNRVAEEEKNGNKLTNKQKTEIYEQVEEDLKKGYISTDTIESVLGGDTYKSYKDTIDSEESTLKEFEELGKKQNATLAEQSRYAELQEKVKEIKSNSNRSQLKSQLSNEIFDLVKTKDGYLAESYNEQGRRGQAYTADVSKYDEKTRATVQKAIDSGILNNTRRTHEFVDMVAKISADKGVLFDFTDNAKLKESGFAVDGKTVNGYVTKDGVTLNIQSAKSLNSVVGHEISHVLEGTELYTELQKAVTEYAKAKKDYDGRHKALTELYKNVEGADIDAELTADLVGDYLFTDADFINNLSTKNRNVFQKLYDEIKYLCKIATAGSKEARQLEKVKRAFDKAYKESGKAKGDTKYSLSMVEAVQPTSDKWRRTLTTEEAKARFPKLWDVTAEESEVRNPTQISSTVNSYRKVYNFLKNEGFDGTILDASSGLGYGTRAGIEEYGFDVDDIEPYPDKSYNPKYRDYSALNKKYDVIISNAVLNVIPQDQRDALVVKMGDMLNEGGRIFINVRGKDVDTLVSNKANTNISPMEWFVDSTGSYQKGFTKPELVAYLKDALGDGFTVKPTNMFGAVSAVVTKDGGVKYSLSDSDGKKLTKEQSEYFKDSKMRDDNGNLKVMYHGSQDAGFHEFNSKFSDDDTSFFFVDRNDVAASYSGTTETYEAQTIRTAEDMNNFIESIGAEGYEVVEKDGKFTLLYEGDRIADSNTAQGIYDEFCWYEGVGEGDANYKVYLNLTNPLEIDAKGRPWNKIDAEFSQEVYDKYKSLTAEEKAALTDLAEWEDFRIFNSEIQEARGNELASAYAKMGEDCNIYDLFSVAADNFSEDSMRENSRRYLKTRDFAQRAKEQGYDGVIFKNIIDNGGYSNGDEGASTVAIAFDSNQIKSVANEKPTADADIRYSLSEDSQGRELSSEQRAYFKDSKIVDDNGNLLVMYHGTKKGGFTVFENKRRKSTEGFYFTNDKEYSNIFQGIKPETGKYYDSVQEGIDEGYFSPETYEVYLDVKNPFVLTADQQDIIEDIGYWENIYTPIKNAGYDGVMMEDKSQVFVFNSNQIKRVDNTKPTSNPDIRYSLSETDNIYLDAVKNNDMETAQKIVDDAAKKSGYTIKAYHGTPNAEFTVFDKDRLGQGNDQYGAGFYFTTDKTGASHYGNRVISAALNINNPIRFTSTAESGRNLIDADITLTSKQAYEVVKRLPNIYDAEESPLGDYFDAYWEVGAKDWMIRELAEQYRDVGYLDSDLFRNYPNELHEALRDVVGYDGVEITFERTGEKFYVAWFDNQMKSTEPITYDDNGNVIPLSERFNADNNDIRYSISGVNARTANSSMLLRAEHMLSAGADSETVRQETGWYKGYDGRMRFEIDDSKSELIENPKLEKHEDNGTYFTGKLSDILNHSELYEAYPQLRNVNIVIQPTDIGTMGIYQPNSNYITLSMELFKRHTKEYSDLLNNRQAEIKKIEESPEYKEYNKWHTDESYAEMEDAEKWLEEEEKARVKFFSSDLGKRYYQLKWGKDPINKYEFGWNKEAKSVLMHEVQHAVQKIENFARGSSKSYWNRQLEEGLTIKTKEQKARQQEVENKYYGMIETNPSFFVEMNALLNNAPNMPRGKVDWDTLEQIEEDPIEWKEFDKKRNALEEKYGTLEVFDFIDLYHEVRRLQNESLTADEAYYLTAGEIEARDTESRLNLNAEQRRNKRPDIDNKRVVFADQIYSLSAEGETPKRYGRYNVYGKDMAIEQAPMQETVPEAENVAPTQDVPITEENTAYEDYAPLTEEEANVMQSERLDSLGDADVPPEIEAPYYGESEDVTPSDPFENRDIKEVGNRKVKAYMYENPEVKPFFQTEANIMLGELRDATRGERFYTEVEGGVPGEYGSDSYGVWQGTKRHASADISYLLDNGKGNGRGYTYDEIEAGLKAIIEDNGAENNACSKRIEFILNDRLMNGYEQDGYDIPANEDYIKLLNEKQITEYTEEAAKRFFDVADDYAPYVEEEEIAPTREYESIEPRPESLEGEEAQWAKNKLARADKEETESRGKRRKWTKTSIESDAVDGRIIFEDLDAEKVRYQPISNKTTLGNANTRLDSMGYETSLAYFNSQFANKRVSLDDVVLGERLIQEALKRGDNQTAGELIQNVAILGTELGQKVQALSIIKRLTPEGQLGMLRKTIERGKTKGDKAYEGVELTQEMIDKILKTYGKDGTFDQTKLNEAVEDVKQQIAKQMKVTVADKANAWRYLSMLGNPKTHIRNLVSNVAMRGTTAVKNVVARTVESIAPVKNRTKTWESASQDVKAFSQKTAVEMKDELSDGGKYNEDASIKAKRKVFKNKILNGVYEFNNDLLSKEDWWFSKTAFTKSLSEYLTANGIRTAQDIQNNPEIVEKAKQYATEQSQIATFRQYSWLANKINEMEKHNTATNIAIGAVLPFKKTPINIAKTALNYSPLGFMKTLTYDAAQVKKGKMEASTMVDHLAQNVTGSALTLVGYLLASAGFLNGGGEDDKEGKYDYQLGKQAYSVNVGGATFSLSWLSPIAMPLFVGANAYEQLVEGKEWNGDVVIETLAQTLDPLSEMSFLSSLDDVLSSYDSGIEKFAGIGQSMAQNYITQFVPTLSSQVATVLDDTKRTTKVAADSDFKFVDETINNLKYKIPFLRETLEPSTDIWGNEVKQSENVLTRAFETFLAPYAKRENIATAVDDELKALYGETGDTGLIPSVPYNYINYDGEKYEMSATDFTEYKKTYGQLAFDLMEKLFDTDTYQNATSEERADMVNKVYDFARDEAKRGYFAKFGVEFTNAEKEGAEYYKENSIKGAIENDMTPDEYEFSTEYPEKYAFFKANGISYNTYKAADEDGKRAYTWAYDNPEKFTLSKAVASDVVEYRKYSSELYDIKADKDEDGKSIVGSRKEKVIEYINNLDADYGEKIILFKNEYNADDTYNAEIIDYLNSRDDISYEEMVTILKELGFTVRSDGTVTW